MNFSDVKAKQILCIADGKNYGSINMLYVDRLSLEARYIANESVLLDVDSIHGATDAIVTVSAPISKNIVTENDYYVLKSGNEIFDCKGAKLGEEFDYPLYTSYKNQRLLRVGEKTYEMDKIVKSNEFILVNTGRQLPVKKSNTTVKNKSEKIDSKASNTNQIKQDYTFLLGRTTKQNITDINGNVLLRLGTVITPAVIECAKTNGKLAELVTYSRG